jgi:subfamily B ATP-binding cassette protein HlyB/CyaB
MPDSVSASALRIPIKPTAFVWCCATLCRELKLPFVQELWLQRFPPPFDIASIQRAAQTLGVESEVCATARVDAGDSGLQFVIVNSAAIPMDPTAAREGADHGDAYELVRVVSMTHDRIDLEVPGGSVPIQMDYARFRQHCDPVACLSFDHANVIAPSAELPPRAKEFGWQWFARELMRYPGIWRDVLIASVAIQMLALVVPLLTQVVLDKVMVHRTINTLAAVAFGLVIVTLFSAVMTWIRQYLILHTGTRIDAVLGARVFAHLMQIPPRYFESRPTGVLVARIHCVETVREFTAGAALTLLLDLPFMLVFAAIMFYYSPTLTWIALGVLCLLVIMSAAIAPMLRSRINRQVLAGAQQQAFLTEYLAGIETVKSLQLEPELNRRFETLLGSYLAAGFAARKLANTFNTGTHALEQLLSVAILCVGAMLVIDGADLTIGGLIAFQMFANRLIGPVLRITGLWQEFQQVDIAVRRLADIMDVPCEPHDLTSPRMSAARGQIECKQLGFRYDARRAWVFRRLDLNIRAGECIALIGPSGSGKSTLVRLLQGFYAPTEGTLMIDGVDADSYAANERRRIFGVVPQECRLFSGTILQNILDAEPTASVEEAMTACRLARIHDAIQALPDGYLTRIGENGVGLSGGQKQRIAIARALIRRPRVLVLDEATASLDPELQGQIVDTVNDLRGKVAVLLVAHRLPERLCHDGVVKLDGASDEQGSG